MQKLLLGLELKRAGWVSHLFQKSNFNDTYEIYNNSVKLCILLICPENTTIVLNMLQL